MKPTNRKSRWLPLILALATLMAILLVACTEGGTEGGTEDTTPANTTATLRLPVSQDADSLVLAVNGVQRSVAVQHHAAELELASGTWQIDWPAK